MVVGHDQLLSHTPYFVCQKMARSPDPHSTIHPLPISPATYFNRSCLLLNQFKYLYNCHTVYYINNYYIIIIPAPHLILSQFPSLKLQLS